MSVILVFLMVVLGVAGWWLLQQRITSKPWLEQGIPAAYPDGDVTHQPTAKIALVVFLAVVGALFALFASAYFMRMEYVDWQAPPFPPVLWLNTGILLLASIALHVAVMAARKGHQDTLRLALVTAALTTLAFLVGQLMAWHDLSLEGYLLDGNPANSFFYLITGLHGLHIVGGIVALSRTTTRAFRGALDEKLTLGVELCAMYWHFLFIVWLAMFVVLAGWASDFIAVCRQFLI